MSFLRSTTNIHPPGPSRKIEAIQTDRLPVGTVRSFLPIFRQSLPLADPHVIVFSCYDAQKVLLNLRVHPCTISASMEPLEVKRLIAGVLVAVMMA
jgi:hypothetical protein